MLFKQTIPNAHTTFSYSSVEGIQIINILIFLRKDVIVEIMEIVNCLVNGVEWRCTNTIEAALGK